MFEPEIWVDVNSSKPTEITIKASGSDALRIVANLSRSELVPVHLDTTGAGLPFLQALMEVGIDVRGYNPGGKN